MAIVLIRFFFLGKCNSAYRRMLYVCFLMCIIFCYLIGHGLFCDSYCTTSQLAPTGIIFFFLLFWLVQIWISQNLLFPVIYVFMFDMCGYCLIRTLTNISFFFFCAGIGDGGSRRRLLSRKDSHNHVLVFKQKNTKNPKKIQKQNPKKCY